MDKSIDELKEYLGRDGSRWYDVCLEIVQCEVLDPEIRLLQPFYIVYDALKSKILESELEFKIERAFFHLTNYKQRISMNQHQQMVLDFHKKYGGAYAEKPTMISPEAKLRRIRLIIEEASEFIDAANKSDMVGMCDALTDLLYVTYGSFCELGVDAGPVFAEVQRSNMTKDGGGKDGGGKIMKGPNFSPPNILPVLQSQGYNG